jgi:hypothetical protein
VFAFDVFGINGLGPSSLTDCGELAPTGKLAPGCPLEDGTEDVDVAETLRLKDDTSRMVAGGVTGLAAR